MTARDRVESSFARQGMMRTLGARVAHVGEGTVRIEAEVSEATSQQQGAGHAGLTFALADSAAGYAALTILAPEQEVVTSEFRISLLAPATGRLVAEGRVIRPGRRLVAVAADVWAGDVLVATALGTMVPVAVQPDG
ncbi:MAG: PaaI family thioesterase [Pseudomonadota bacterium]